MAPRTPKPKAEDADPLKPKTEKAKIEKTKVEKPKGEKVKAEKKPKAEKTEKVKVEKKIPAERVNKGDTEKGEKEKVKAVTGDEAMELIAVYLKAQNRPYSATEISANLRGKVTKTVADKLLKDMEQNKQIMAKATNGDKKGSQWVFWPLQDPADSATPEELASMDTQISELRLALPVLKSSLKLATSKINTILDAPTSTQLASTIESLQEENEKKKRKLEGFKTGEVKQISKEEMDKVDKEYKYWANKSKARKKAFQGVEDILLSHFSREELWEKAGIEGDDE